MNTLSMFSKETIIHVTTQPGRAISGAVLFAHLRSALEGCSLTGDSVLIIQGDGSVQLDGETVYTPRRMMQNVSTANKSQKRERVGLGHAIQNPGRH